MMILVTHLTLILSLVLGCSAVFSRVSLDNNAYSGILVAINPNIQEDPTIVESLKDMITEASSVMFASTRKRAYFADVTILVPKTWNGSYVAARAQSYDLADVIVADANPVYGDSPYTLQYGQCGEPGSYIHVTPDFLRDDSFVTDFGPRGKTFVHEWAHLRWGVYDEAPTEGYEDFYFDSQQNVQATRCPLGLKGRHLYFPTGDPDKYGACKANPNTGLPEDGCVFVPYSEVMVNTSIMSHQFLEEVVEFCDDQDEENIQYISYHNTEAPNEHNRLCDTRSVWSVMRSSPDFNNTNPPNNLIGDVTPTFHVVQARPFEKFVLVLDVSGSMGGKRLEDMKTAASLFVSQFLPNGTKAGIVQFHTDATILHDLILIDDSRDVLVDIISKLNDLGSTCIGCGIKDGLKVLESDGGTASGGHLLVLSDGGENQSPFVRDVRDEVINKGAVVDSIFFGVSTANQDLQDLTEETQGSWFFNDDMDSGALLESFKELAYLQDGDVYKEVFQLYGESFVMGTYDLQNGAVYIDPTIGNQTVFTFSYSVSDILVFLSSPDGLRYCTYSIGHCDGFATVDVNLKTIMFSIPGTATVGSWSFNITSKNYADTVDVIVTSMAANREVQPMIVEAGMSNLDPSNLEPVVVYAKVAVGYTPILGADVIATVTAPSGAQYILTLLDSGSAPDVRKYDGVYSRYFTQFIEAGRHSVQVKVSGLGNQSSSTFTSSKSSSATYNPGTVQSDGTVVVNPKGPSANGGSNNGESGISTSDIDPFARVVSPGGFSYSGAVLDPTSDPYPPSKVIDLRAEQVDVTDLSRGVRLTFSAPGADYDSGTASKYDIRYSYNGTKELVDNFDRCRAVSECMLIEGDFLAPKEAGSAETFVTTLLHLPEGKEAMSVWFAMRSHDATHASPTSNVDMMNVFIVPFTVESTAVATEAANTTTATSPTTVVITTTTPGKSETQKKLEIFQLVTIILGAVCIVEACALVAACIMQRSLRKQRKKYQEKLSSMVDMDASNHTAQKSSWPENEYQMIKRPEIKSSAAHSNSAYTN